MDNLSLTKWQNYTMDKDSLFNSGARETGQLCGKE